MATLAGFPDLEVSVYNDPAVPSLAHSGVKFFSIGPNHIHRIGYTLADWGEPAEE